MIELEWSDQGPLDGSSAAALPEPRHEGDGETPEASQALRYLVDQALRFGRVKDFGDLLEEISAYRQYRPFNALLLLLQRPGVSHVLPAHRWEERYGRRIRPAEQPLIALVRGGPIIFVFDLSQTEETENSTPVPAFKDPIAMDDLSEAAGKLHWIIENAKADGVRVSKGGLGHGFGGCIWCVENAPSQEVLVRRRPKRETQQVQVSYETLLGRNLKPIQQLAVLSHELGHLYCGHVGTHNEQWWRARTGLGAAVKEAEADSVARIVVRSLAPGISLPAILRRNFSDQDLLDLSLELVSKAAGRILDMTEGLAPRREPYVSKRVRELEAAVRSNG